MTISSKQLGLLAKQLGLLSNNSHKLSSPPSNNPQGQLCEEQGERSG